MDLTPWSRRNFVILVVLWFLFIALSSVAAVANPVLKKTCDDRQHLTVCVDDACTTAPCEEGTACLSAESDRVKTTGCYPPTVASNPDTNS